MAIFTESDPRPPGPARHPAAFLPGMARSDRRQDHPRLNTCFLGGYAPTTRSRAVVCPPGTAVVSRVKIIFSGERAQRAF